MGNHDGILCQAAQGAHLVDARLAGLSQGGHRLRRGGTVRENPGHGTGVLPVGHELLPKPEVRSLREDHRLPPAKRAVGDSAEAGSFGGNLPGEADGKSGHSEAVGAGESVLHLRRSGRKLRVSDSGHYLCRNPSGRNRPDAPLLRGAGLRPVLRGGKPALVQLQPGRAGALVLQNLDSGGGKAELPAAPIYHGG